MTPAEMARIHAASFKSAPRPWTLAEITDLLNMPDTPVFTEPGGFLMLRCMGPEAEILTIAVHPDHRRQGIAARLLAQMFRFARDTGIEDVFLEVSIRNTAAKALYRAQRFARCGERKDYYRDHNGNKITALVMRRTVGAA